MANVFESIDVIISKHIRFFRRSLIARRADCKILRAFVTKNQHFIFTCARSCDILILYPVITGRRGTYDSTTFGFGIDRSLDRRTSDLCVHHHRGSGAHHRHHRPDRGLQIGDQKGEEKGDSHRRGDASARPRQRRGGARDSGRPRCGNSRRHDDGRRKRRGQPLHPA